MVPSKTINGIAAPGALKPLITSLRHGFSAIAFLVNNRLSTQKSPCRAKIFSSTESLRCSWVSDSISFAIDHSNLLNKSLSDYQKTAITIFEIVSRVIKPQALLDSAAFLMLRYPRAKITKSMVLFTATFI